MQEEFLTPEERRRINQQQAANIATQQSLNPLVADSALSDISSGIGSENPYRSDISLDAAPGADSPYVVPTVPALDFIDPPPTGPLPDFTPLPVPEMVPAKDLDGLLGNVDVTTQVNRNIFNANPAAYYQAFRMAVPNYPDVGVEEFQKIIQEERYPLPTGGEVIQNFAEIVGQTPTQVIEYFARGGYGSPEYEVLQKFAENPALLSGEQMNMYNEMQGLLETGGYVPATGARFLGPSSTGPDGNNISTGLPGAEVAGFSPDEQIQAQDYLREIQKYLTGLTDVVPTLPTNLARTYADAAGIQQPTPEYQTLLDAYQGALAEQTGREMQQTEFDRELQLQQNQLDADSEALAKQLDSNNYAAYIQAYNNDNNITLQRYLESRNNSLERFRIEQAEQLARITGQNDKEIQQMISQAQQYVAERNGISAREVADIQAGVASQVSKDEITIASIQQQMQQEIARLTGLDERYIADQQAEAQKTIAAENRAAEERIALESRTANIAIAQSTNTAETEIAKISADAQIQIAEDNRISQEKVALANSLNVVAAAEATGLSQEKVAQIQGDYNKAVAEATGLSAQEVARIQGLSQEQIAKIKSASEVQVAQQQASATIQAAQQAAQAQTGAAQLGAAEQRFATTTQAGTERAIAQLQADTQTRIAQIQSDTSRDQAAKNLEIATVQQQAQEAIARIQQEGQLAIAQQQTNPFGLSAEEYMAMQTAPGAVSPADTLSTQQYIDLQNSLARGGLSPAQQIQLYEAQQQAQASAQRGGLTPQDFISLQESIARGGLTPEQRLAEQQQGQSVQALTALLTLLSNPSALGALSTLSSGQTPFGGAIPSAAALQGRSNEFLNFLQGAFGAAGITPSALVNLIQGVTPAGVSNPFGALTGQVA